MKWVTKFQKLWKKETRMDMYVDKIESLTDVLEITTSLGWVRAYKVKIIENNWRHLRQFYAQRQIQKGEGCH